MSIITSITTAFLNLFRFHKFKIFLTFFSAFVFALFIFPYDDLSEVVSAKVSELTNDQVFLQFDRLGFQLFPLPALAVENVAVESHFFPSLQASRISLAPSIMGFLTARPGFNAGAHDVWGGNIDVELQSGKKLDNEAIEQNIRLEVERVNLAKMNESIELPLKLQGSLSGDVALKLDPSFTNQPNGEISVNANELRFPSGTIAIPNLGPLMIPGLSWKKISLEGRLTAGKFSIEKGEIGSANDLLNGSIKGEIEVKIERTNAGQLGSSFGAYSLNVDLNVSDKLDKDLGLFMALAGKYKTATTSGSRLKFKISGRNFTQAVFDAYGTR